MKVQSFLSLAFTLVLVAGCGKDKPNAVDSDGNCTSSYTSSYNDMVYTMKSLKYYFNDDGSLNSSGQNSQSQILSKVKQMDRQCDSFLSNYKGVSCTAYNEETYSKVTTQPAEIEKTCVVFKGAANSAQTALSTEIATAQFTEVQISAPAEMISDEATASKN